MNKPTVRLAGLRRTLAIGALSPLLMTAALQAQTAAEAETPVPASASGTDDDLVILDKFEVVGSRIKRLDNESVSPVVQIRPATMQATGYVSIADALRSLPYNGGQALTSADAGTSFTPGISTINLRGLGNNNTLVLINGRRSAPYSVPGYDGFQTMFDLNSIPEAALDGVEILKDGASALYGSDAVAGVVNFRFRRDFQGTIAKAEVGNYFDTGGMLLKASVLSGAVVGKTSIVSSIDWSRQDPVFARDLKISREADKSAAAVAAKPYYRGSGWEDVTVPGYTFANEAEYVALGSSWYGLSSDPVADGIFDGRSSRGYPGYVSFVTDDGAERFTYTTPTSSPRTTEPVSGSNRYNFQEDSGLFSQEERYSFFTSIRHDFSDALYGFADLSFSRSESNSQSAPTPVDIESEQGLTTGSYMYLPWSNPYNPFSPDTNNTNPDGLTNGRRRLVELGNRVSEVTSDTPRAVLGLGGKITGWEGWTWESAGMYAKNRVKTNALNAVTDFGMQQALLGLTEGSDGKLTYNPSTPASERVYFNWFGENDPAIAEFLSTTNRTGASLRYLSADISASGPLYNLPGGPLGLAVGAEFRKEKFANERSELNATANIVGGDEGTSSRGQRDVTSVYGELSVPVVKGVEFQVAGRFEKYSDKDFPRSVRPKLGFKVRPNDWLLLRGSYSKSFKAPDLAYLYTSSTTTFTSFPIWDSETEGWVDGLKVVTVGNPVLKPELTDSWYAGLVIEPKGVLKGLEFDLDFFRYERSNLLDQYSNYFGYSQFLTKAASGDVRFANKVIRDPDTNEVVYVRDDYTNIYNGLTQGVDAAVRYHWETGRFGDVILGASVTYNDKNELDGENYVGTRVNARWNGTASIAWLYRDWEVNSYAVYRGRRTGSYDLGSIFGPADYPDPADYEEQSDNLYVSYRIKPQVTLNASVTYKGFKKLKVTVGVNNLLNDEPPSDPQETSGFTPGVSDPAPAFWYVALEREF